jgi:hypothetical protein
MFQKIAVIALVFGIVFVKLILPPCPSILMRKARFSSMTPH